MPTIYNDINNKIFTETETPKPDLYLGALMNTGVDGFLITDPQGMISELNEPAIKLSGKTRNSLIGSNFKDLFTDSQKAQTFIQEVLKSKIARQFEFNIQGVGREVAVSCNGIVIGSDVNNIRGLFISMRNISQAKQFEEDLKQKNVDLKKANILKDTFLANLSHELRTPLNAIVGFTGTLLMQLPGPLNDEQKNQLNIVKRCAMHLLSLINGLIDLAKIDAGKVDVHFEMISCEKIMLDVATTLTPLAEAKSMKISVQLLNKDIDIRSDRRILSQILINFVNNAIKFSKNGEVKIVYEKRQQNNENFAVISVIDTGPGIKIEDQDKLFQAFQQLTHSNTKLEGSGLGLHISKRLSDVIHASLEFESELGKGSRFAIVIPTGTEHD